ncbi:hypothetical protein GUJ93_ZPchr0008g13627 [Zizania palustris]|uniref:Meiosis 5 n=1 Tax=Zizania palustris TaxID=103762 RepID=A0A8J5RG95_ZIZPA|nr:hypothetical protein GUJ93_ZPchr0008g13627 [Zizania palustris]
MAKGLSLLLALGAALAFVSVGVESRSSPMEKASQEDGVKKPDCVPAFDPRSFPGHGGTTTPLPSHGGSGTTPTAPSHGGGSGYGTPPTAPSHGGSGTLPAPSHGGYGTTPSAPSHGGYGSSPAAPSTGGGYGGSPTTPSHGGGYGSSPSTPATGGGYGGSPTTPSHGGGYGSSPSTPSHDGGGGYGSSPTTPSHGGGAYGGGSTPTPSAGGHGLVPVDPSSPGTCDYWRSHPMEIWSALGRWPSSVGHFFGSAGGSAAGGTGVTIQDALSNTRTDGAGALLREATAALLNSMTRAGFPYTTEQVRDAFAAATAGGSDTAAAAQAAAFKKANEGRA